jgi:hypothetical protein
MPAPQHFRSYNIPNRSRTSFQKRQKELARAEKQRDKAAKREQRKLTRQDSPGGSFEIAELSSAEALAHESDPEGDDLNPADDE